MNISQDAVAMMEAELEGISHEMVEIIPLPEAAERLRSDETPKVESGYQDLDNCIRGGFHEGDLTIITGVSGEGKCLAKGTKVLMFDGTTRSVETIKVGEKLMGPDSKPRNVLALGRGNDEMFKIQQIKGDSFIVNKDHILVVKGRENQVKEITVKDALAQKMSTAKWRCFAVPVEYAAKKVELDPYFLGLWLGDGNTRDVRITSADVEIENWLKDFAVRLGLKFRKVPQPSKAFSMMITKGRGGLGFSLQSELRRLNFLNNKHIPHEYIANSREVRLQLLAGLIDTDGYVNHGGYVFVNKIEQMALDVQKIARSLGMRAYIQKYHNKKYNRWYYKVGISGDCSVIPVRIARKKVQPRKQIKDILKTGFKIIPQGKGEYYGFQIDGDGRFLLGDFTVTHNTTLARCFTLSFAAKTVPSVWFSYEMNTTELWKSFEEMGAKTDLISFVPVQLEQDLAWILAHAKYAKERHGCKAIFIDTLGDIVKYTKDKTELQNGALMLSNICKALRMFAIKEGMMIFLVAHAVKTGMRKDVDKETYNDDVAYSAGIVQAATNVLHVWRRKGNETVVKIGKSRRDGSSHGKKLSFQFQEGKLLAQGFAVDNEQMDF